MLSPDALRHPGLGGRLVLALVMLLPLLCGAVAASFIDDEGTTTFEQVAIVMPPGAKPNSTSSKLASALQDSPGFSWRVTSATDAAAQLSAGTVFAVVTIPDTFGKTKADPGERPGTVDRPAEQVIVAPGQDAADRDYSRLVQAASSTATRIGIEGLLVSVSQARTNLNVATLIAAGLKAAALNADSTVNEVLNSVKQLVGQSDPLVAQAQTLVDAIRQYSALIGDITGRLSTFAAGMQGMTLTLGDLQQGVDTLGNGLETVGTALQATAAVRAELTTAVRPVADVLRASGLPEGQRVGDQLVSLLALIGGLDDPRTSAQIDGIQTGAELLSAQLGDLSALLGRPVGTETRLVEVLDLSVERLTSIGAFLAQGDTTINRVMAQLDGARELIPGMEAQIRAQLEQLKAVTGQLVTSLNTGVNGLPDTSAATASGLSRAVAPGAIDTNGSTPDSGLVRTVLGLLAGALLIALTRSAVADRSAQRGSTPRGAAITSWTIAGLLALGLSVVGVLSSDRGHTLALFISAVVAVLALVAMCAALIRLFGRFGLGVAVALIALTALVDIGVRHDAAGDAFGIDLLPSSYAFTALDAAELSGTTRMLPLIVLTALGLCSLTAYVRYATMPSRDHE
ncbi:hypothetical protein [Nocardia sp. NPDC050710]|uniref:hypothetical protein n=1 Tax=Nocardia sp. NPDC050710 TaxID=3157220 RepID=UPI0034063B5C